MTRFPLIFAILLISSGCCSAVDTKIGIPPRPELIPITDPIAWDRVPPEIQDAVTLNDLALKEYARKLESRIRSHDEAL